MAQAKKASFAIAGALAASLSAATAAAPGYANADEAAAACTPPTEAVQRSEFSEANGSAFAHAREHGVAILIHVGMDYQCHEEADALLQWTKDQFQQAFAQQGINVGIFTRLNDAAGTGLAYHVGDHIYTPAGSDDALIGLQTAFNLVPDVAEQGRIALQLAELNVQPQPTGG